MEKCPSTETHASVREEAVMLLVERTGRHYNIQVRGYID